MFVNKSRKNGEGWIVGIESPDISGTKKQAPEDRVAVKEYELFSGGIATSGDARRYLLKDGIRYGHILDPRTGWPVMNAPHSVTVAAGTCTEAGILATLAILQGEQAEEFLEQQGITYWCIR
jgi:thiamine biosynthesis lipoprotein